MCNCKKYAVRQVAQNDLNKGRKYFGCGYKPGCGYFEWVGTDEIRKCRCGLKPIQLTAKTSINQNRPFYKCKKEKCTYFEWGDIPTQTKPKKAKTGSLKRLNQKRR